MDVCDLLVSGSRGTALVPVLAAGVAVVAWLGKSYVSGFLYYFARYSDQIEILSALKAEITIIIDHVPIGNSDTLVADLEAKYAADKDHRLFMPLYRETIVFDALKRDVTALTERSLKEVIAFYNMSGGLDVLQSSMTTERFESFAPQRRVELFKLFLEKAKATADAGQLAAAVIDSELVLIRLRRIVISIGSVLAFGLGAMLVWQGVRAVSACDLRGTAHILHAGPDVADLFGSSDERRENRPHVAPHKRLSGENDNHKQYIAAIVPGFNLMPARDRRLSISGGRNVAA